MIEREPNFHESQNPLYFQHQKKKEMHILPDNSLFKGSHVKTIMEGEKKKHLKRHFFFVLIKRTVWSFPDFTSFVQVFKKKP